MVYFQGRTVSFGEGNVYIVYFHTFGTSQIFPWKSSISNIIWQKPARMGQPQKNKSHALPCPHPQKEGQQTNTFLPSTSCPFQKATNGNLFSVPKKILRNKILRNSYDFCLNMKKGPKIKTLTQKWAKIAIFHFPLTQNGCWTKK